MPLLLLDLDDTLLDRAAAFRSWAADFLAGLGAPDDEIAWLVEVDADGYRPRESVAEAILARFGPIGRPEARLAEDMRHGVVERLTLDPGVTRAIGTARDAGWVPVVVTNGATAQQERKISRAGLAEWVAAWIVSESAGFAKPDRRIFELAARAGGLPLDGAWMIGDSPAADIAGAHHAGIGSVWLHRGRAWTEPAYRPTAVADDCAQAIGQVVSG